MQGLLRVRAVIFDIDGVLLDARASYHAVAEEAARRSIAPLVGEAAARAVPFDRSTEVGQFKQAGRFNDDWEMTRGIALLLLLRARGCAPPLATFLAEAHGDGVSGLFAGRVLGEAEARALAPEPLARVCGALYGGRSRCLDLFGFEAPPEMPDRGYWEREELLVETALLERIMARFPVALYTGRNPGEAALALERTGLLVPPALRWVADGRPRKPDPAGLVWLCKMLLSKPIELPAKARPPAGAEALFVGDTADDEAAARAAQALGAPLIYAHIQAPGDTARVLSSLLESSESPSGEPT